MLPPTSPTDPLLALTAAIVSAWLASNPVKTTGLVGVIRTVHETLVDLEWPVTEARSPPETPASTAGKHKPAPLVDARQSVFSGHIVCLECGGRRRTLRRHLSMTHGLTPEQYRGKWNLPDSYPIVAPEYSTTRSRMAKASGLGKNRLAR